MENLKFKPDRYLQDNPAAAEKFAFVPFGAGMFTYYIPIFPISNFIAMNDCVQCILRAV